MPNLRGPLRPRVRLARRLTIAFVAFALVILVASGLVATLQMRSLYATQLRADLERRALLLADLWAQLPAVDAASCTRAAKTLDARVVVLNTAAVVACDSDGILPVGTTAFADEVRALDGVDRVRSSAATPGGTAVLARGSGPWLVRASVRSNWFRAVWAQVNAWVLMLYGLVLIAAAVLARRVAAGLTQPLRIVTEALAARDLGNRPEPLKLPELQEYAELVSAFNNTLAELEGRTELAQVQRGELEAVLNSMVEGVIAIDDEQRIFNINRAAYELLGIQPPAVGRTVREVLRLPAFHRFIDAVLATSGTHEDEADIETQGTERTLHLRGTRVAPIGPRHGAAVIVVEDVTRVRRLERVRRDFAANVSHELKTPITSVKGYAETLLDGALEDLDAARRFTAAIVRQADRLTAIIDDLLTLARIERFEEGGGLRLEPVDVAAVVDEALATCSAAAAEKDIHITVLCPEGLEVRGNAALLVQALTNLIVNAIKYSEASTRVTVDVQANEQRVRIAVRDQGPGIPREALPRLFERFYRIDASRSRDAGGTGLGLAIVKHIMGVHGGRVLVESALGEGSTFTLDLPRA